VPEASARAAAEQNNGPEMNDFGIAIPRARMKLSENAEAEANLIN
jgi:hypothetical protein